MRLIEVDVLKAWIENWFTKNRHYHPYAKNNDIPITELYDILEQMPSAQPEDKCGECDAWNQYKNYPRQQWIPCSERLPDESGKYLVTAFEGTVKVTTIVLFQSTYRLWGLTGRRAYWKVIAWMPLPEPYTERDEQQNEQENNISG